MPIELDKNIKNVSELIVDVGLYLTNQNKPDYKFAKKLLEELVKPDNGVVYVRSLILLEFQSFWFMKLENSKFTIPYIEEIKDIIPNEKKYIDNVIKGISEKNNSKSSTSIAYIDANFKNMYKEDRDDDLGAMHYDICYKHSLSNIEHDMFKEKDKYGWIDTRKNNNREKFSILAM